MQYQVHLPYNVAYFAIFVMMHPCNHDIYNWHIIQTFFESKWWNFSETKYEQIMSIEILCLMIEKVNKISQF